MAEGVSVHLASDVKLANQPSVSKVEFSLFLRAILLNDNWKSVLLKSNRIIFIGVRSSIDYYTRPGGGVGIWEGSLGCGLCLG